MWLFFTLICFMWLLLFSLYFFFVVVCSKEAILMVCRSKLLNIFVCVCRKEATHIRLGDFNYGSDREHYKPMNVKVARVLLHPDYNKQIFYNNIALVELDQSVDFTEHIRPACLPQVSDVVDESVSMTGWPFKLYNVPRSMRHKQDMTLRKYDMNAIDETECKQIFTPHNVDGMPNGITDTQMCASIRMEDGNRHFKILRPLEVRKSHMLKLKLVRVLFAEKKNVMPFSWNFRFSMGHHFRLCRTRINVCTPFWDYHIFDQHLD